MAGLYGATREWDLVAAAVVPQRMPTGLATGLTPVAAAAVAATVLLLLTTGFRFGFGNQVQAILDTASRPQFARLPDQDLQRIVAFVWPLERPFAIAANSHTMVLACGVLTVFGCCFALLRIIARLAAADAIGLAAGGLLIGMTYLDSGSACLSGDALVGGYLGATQVATALVALSLACAVDGSPRVAVALLGVAFDMETAVALWGVVGLAGASVALARDGAPVGRAWLTGGVCALVLGAPAVMWWAREIAGGGFAGDYVAWLGVARPDQILAWTVPLERWVLMGSALVLGLAAFSVLGSDARATCGAFLGFLAVFAVGCVLPLLIDNPWLLILRPMAADTFLQLLAAVAAIAVVLRDLRGGGGVLRVALSVAIAACLLLHRYLLPLAALLMLTRAAAAHGELLGLERRIRDCNQVTLCRVALAVVLLAGVAGGVVRGGLPLH